MDTAKENQDGDGTRTSLSQFFKRVDNIDSLSPDDFLDRFERYGFLWFKSKSEGSKGSAKIPTGNQILDFVKEYSSACETNWTIENHSKDTLNSSSTSLAKIIPQKLHDFTGTNTSFYVSTIVHRKLQEGQFRSSEMPMPTSSPNCSPSPAHQSLMEMLPKFDAVFEDIYENGDPSGTWLFLGHHGVSVGPADAIPRSTCSTDDKKLKKRKLCHDQVHDDANAIPRCTTLIGRAEHVDEVSHSGTYHIQISGTKTWKIRPHPDSFLAEELLIDSEEGSLFRTLPGAGTEPQGSASKSKGDNCWRLTIHVEEGDVFVLNTKIWYHCTELNFAPKSKSDSEWSISVAQDFYLPVPCPKNVQKGDVVYGYGYNVNGEIDEKVHDESNESRVHVEEEIPEELPRSDTPNCVLVEIDDDANDDDRGHNDDETSETSAEPKIALVALRDINEGESLTIAFDPHDDQLGNANEQIDPRVISRQSWSQNQIVLRGEDRMPRDIPRSLEPNCELVELHGDESAGGAGSCMALRALVDIPKGGVFCILPDEDEDYDEVEVDLETGELVV